MPDLTQKPWETCAYTLPGDVNTLLTPPELQLLYYLARHYFSGHGAIIDAGPFLGGSTRALLDGLAENKNVKPQDTPLHAYDLFEIVDNSGTWGLEGEKMGVGYNFLEDFKRNLGDLGRHVTIHQGDVLQQSWEGGPIEILFIDIAKSPETLGHLERTFFPHLIPGRSIVIQQDLQYPGCPWIPMSMHQLRDYFTTLDHLPYNSSVYLCSKAIPQSALSNFDYRSLEPEERLLAHTKAIESLPDRGRTLLRLNEIIWMLDQKQPDRAVEQLAAIQRTTSSDLSIYATFVATAQRLFPDLYSPEESIAPPDSIVHDHRLSLASQMSVDERLMLFTLVRCFRPKRMLEVGRARGGSTHVIAESIKHLEGTSFVSMDPNNWPEHSIASVLRKRLEDDHGVQFIDEYCPWALPRAKHLAGGDFDLIFLDGDHSYEAVKRDLQGLLPFLVEGGYIIMHDSHFLPLRRAIAEVVDETGVVDCGNLVAERNEELADTLTEGLPTYYGGLHLLRKVTKLSPNPNPPYAESSELPPTPSEKTKQDSKDKTKIEALKKALKASQKELESERGRRFWPKLKRSIAKRLSGANRSKEN